MAVIRCQICNKEFEAVGFNTKYCKECAVAQKKQQDHEAWLRRRLKAAKETRALDQKSATYLEMEKQLQRELGISEYFFKLWKADNQAFLKHWISEKIQGKKPAKDNSTIYPSAT